MRIMILAVLFLAGTANAQPAEFDAADFGRIVITARQSSDGLTFEQAFGDYQNEPVVDYGPNGPAVKMGRPIGRLDLLYDTGKPGFCTAFIVDSQHIMTNHHCIPGMDGDATGAVSGVTAAQFVAGYINPGRAVDVDKFTVSPQIVETSRDLDYTILQVFGDPSQKYGVMELAEGDPEDAEFLWIIGHPEGQSQHISREGCAAATPAMSAEGKLVHTCDTLSGNSGSPVIRISDRRVVGLHHAGNSRTGFNQAIPMRRILDHSKVLKAAVTPANPEPATQACTALWTEAKTLGCRGFETYLTDCADHTFADLARGQIAENCTPAVTESSTPPADVPDHSGATLVVAPQGGDHTDLASAIRAAEPGTRITVMPGTYPISVTVGKPLEIVGSGDPASVVLTGTGGTLIQWEAGTGLIANLTLRQNAEDPALEFSDGTATITGVSVDAAGTGIAIFGNSTPILRANTMRAQFTGIVVGDAAARPVIEGNDISAPQGSAIEVFDAGPDIIANTLHDSRDHAIYIEGNMPGRIENNVISGIGESDIHRQ